MAMSRRLRLPLAALAIVVALGALSGCTIKTTPAGSAANTVTATGTGTAQGSPDEAAMSFGVTRHAGNAKAALSDVSNIAEGITKALVKKGIDKQDIQTENISVFPQISNVNGKQLVTGFDATISVRVKTRAISRLGDIIAAGNSAGADNISGPTFTMSDPAPTRAEALDDAVADARTTAEAMAKAAGKSVGGVLSISTGTVSTPPGPLFDSAARLEKSVPVEPGQLDITADVTVVFELK